MREVDFRNCPHRFEFQPYSCQSLPGSKAGERVVTRVAQWQAAGLNRRRIGDYIVTALVDGVVDAPFDLLAGISLNDAEEMIVASGRPRSSAMTVGAYLLEGGGKTILIDGGAGGINGWGGRLHAALAAANIDPRQVDHVLLTHAHPDHIGGLIGATSSAGLFRLSARSHAPAARSDRVRGLQTFKI
jgi:Metallo-beta-lactamase superfamily